MNARLLSFLRRSPGPKPDYARIRRMELELGLREPNMDDVRDVIAERHAQVRYVESPEEILAVLREQYARGEPIGPTP